MKRYIIIMIIACFFCSGIQAQKSVTTLTRTKKEVEKAKKENKNPFCITLGYVSKNAVAKADGDKHKSSLLLGMEGDKTSAFLLGISRVWEMKYGIGLESGLNIELAREKESIAGYKYKSFNTNFSIPLKVQYRYEIIDNLSVFAYTGPGFDISLFTTSDNGEKSDTKWLWDDNYKPFDLTWSLGIGAQYKFLKLRIGREWGLFNKTEANGYKLKYNKPFVFTLSFLM